MNYLSLKNRRIAITGGSGFIGSHLLESLIDKNEIIVIDNEYRGSNLSYIKKANSKRFKENVQFVNSDIRNQERLLKIFKEFKPEIVFHLAGIAGVPTVLNKPMEVIDVNLIGSYSLARVIVKIDSVRKLVYTSTSEVYGPTAYQLKEDSFTTQGNAYDPRWSYSASKMFAEHIFVALEREHGIDICIGRLFNVYGPKQIGDSAIHEFIRRAIVHNPFTIYDDGAQIRAWCYVTDCITGLRLITEKGHGIYNIGNPSEALTTIALAKFIIDLTKSKSKLVFKKLRSSDVRVRVPNIEKLSELGYYPQVGLKHGLMKTIEWYKKES